MKKKSTNLSVLLKLVQNQNKLLNRLKAKQKERKILSIKYLGQLMTTAYRLMT